MNNLIINNINDLVGEKKVIPKIFTTITDSKKIYNLENNVDFKVNDYKGKEIKLKDVYIKVLRIPLEEKKISKDNKEYDYELKKICILVDDKDKSYITASKMFTNQMIDFINMFGLDEVVEIRIIEKQVKGSDHKALGFELV